MLWRVVCKGKVRRQESVPVLEFFLLKDGCEADDLRRAINKAHTALDYVLLPDGEHIIQDPEVVYFEDENGARWWSNRCGGYFRLYIPPPQIPCIGDLLLPCLRNMGVPLVCSFPQIPGEPGVIA